MEVVPKSSENEVQGGQEVEVEGGAQVVSTSEELEYMMESSSQRE